MSFFNKTVFNHLIAPAMIVFLLWLPAWLDPVHAADARTKKDADCIREKAVEIQKAIKDRQSEIAGYTRREKQLLDALDATQRKMDTIRRKLRGINKEIADVDETLAEARKKTRELESRLSSKRMNASRRLVALYKMGQLGKMNLLVSAGSMNEFLARKAALERILDHDQQVVAEQLERQRQLNAMLNALESQKERKTALEEKQRQMMARLKEKREESEQFLSAIRSQKENCRTVLKYLTATAARLDKKIGDLQQQSGIIPEPARFFGKYQGLLNIPVEGKIITNYGQFIEPRSGAANFRNGIEIQAHRGAPVRAVFDGKTVYADWLQGYGNVIIIAHSNDYHTVYAHAEEIFLSRGDPVARGDVIATVGDSGSLGETALYFEIRHHGNPVNPMEWIDNS